jgi:cytochrome P450
MADQIAYNPFDLSFHADPYPHYRQLLAGPPPRVAIGSPVMLIARYADVVAVTRDHASFSSALPQYAVSRGGNPFGGAMTLPFADPPVHTRLRRLVARDFSPRRRAAARKAKDFALADQLRKELEARGYEVKDNRDGTATYQSRRA